MTSSVSGKTTILVCQDPAAANGNKAQAARARGVRITTRADIEAALGVEGEAAPAKKGPAAGGDKSKALAAGKGKSMIKKVSV